MFRGLLGAAVLEFDSIAPLLGLLASLAFLVEATVEVAFTGWLKWLASLVTAWTEEQRAEFRAIIQRFAAFGLGIALCLSMGLDLIAAVAALGGVDAPVVGPLGAILTGILIGRGNGRVRPGHDLEGERGDRLSVCGGIASGYYTDNRDDWQE